MTPEQSKDKLKRHRDNWKAKALKYKEALEKIAEDPRLGAHYFSLIASQALEEPETEETMACLRCKTECKLIIGSPPYNDVKHWICPACDSTYNYKGDK